MKTFLKTTILTFLIFFTSIVLALSQANCYYDQSPEYWKISETLYGSKKLSGCDDGANYNCHGFMMSYFEDNCTQPGWNNITPTPYSCPVSKGTKLDYQWKNSGRYVHVCNESDAKLVYYQFPGGETHSAVKETLPGGIYKYISKYNHDGPLVEHNIDGSWYHLSGLYNPNEITRQFWTYVGFIQGSQTIIGTGITTYSLLSNQGVNYSWSIISGNSNISISSGANQSTVNLVPNHSGTAILKVSLSSGCDTDAKSQQINLNITTNICLEGTYDNAGIYNQNLNTVNHVSTGGVAIRVSCPNSTVIKWQRTSGNVNGLFLDGQTASFNMTAGGSITLLLTAKNGSVTIGTRSITFYN